MFRFDAGPAIGGGHALRCLTLAKSMSRAGWECWFAINKCTQSYGKLLSLYEPRCIPLSKDPAQEPLDIEYGLGGRGCDLLIIDHYGRDAIFETACRSYVDRIMVIDDLADRKHDADLLLDQNLGRETNDYSDLVPSDCRLLLGPRFALLRPQFVSQRTSALARRKGQNHVEKILISFGMSDPKNLSHTALKALFNIRFSGHIDVVIGDYTSSYTMVRLQAQEMGGNVRILSDVENMAKVMANADLAVGGGGMTAWERCAMGLPAVSVVYAPNQVLSTRALFKSGAIWMIEDLSVNQDSIQEKLNEIISDYSSIRQASIQAEQICDAEGCGRVIKIING